MYSKGENLNIFDRFNLSNVNHNNIFEGMIYSENIKKNPFLHAVNFKLKFSFLFIRKYATQNPGIFINLPFTVERQDLEELCLLNE